MGNTKSIVKDNLANSIIQKHSSNPKSRTYQDNTLPKEIMNEVFDVSFPFTNAVCQNQKAYTKPKKFMFNKMQSLMKPVNNRSTAISLNTPLKTSKTHGDLIENYNKNSITSCINQPKTKFAESLYKKDDSEPKPGVKLPSVPNDAPFVVKVPSGELLHHCENNEVIIHEEEAPSINEFSEAGEGNYVSSISEISDMGTPQLYNKESSESHVKMLETLNLKKSQKFEFEVKPKVNYINFIKNKNMRRVESFKKKE